MKESEIRSRNIQDEYLQLCRKDAIKLLEAGTNLVEISCPACDCKEKEIAFYKDGFEYCSCVNCQTLYLNKRPTEECLLHFNSNSENTEYWADVFYPQCAEKRRNSVYKPRAEYVKQIELKYNKKFSSFLDIGTGYGIFMEELSKVFPDKKVMGLEPGKKLIQECRKRKLNVFEGVLSQASHFQNNFDFCSCFEVLEHVFSPVAFLQEVISACKYGGVVFMNTLCCDGFDIQIMWEKHRNIYPVNHINIMSVKGIEILFKRAGFDCIFITTPGKLDLDIIRNQMTWDELPRFLKTIYRKDDEELIKKYQQFLANNNLSSHVWIVAQKP